MSENQAPNGDGFRAPAIVPKHETAITAAAAQAQASINARYVMALQRPRIIDDARRRILGECQRPGFAKAAMFSLPRGKKPIEGLSIRFAEAAIRCMTNILVETQTIYDDEEKRIIRVIVTDLEANVTYPTDKVIVKTVERRQVRDGQESVGQRVNTSGDTVYIVRATEEDLAMKEAAIVSKAMRTNGLRLIPGDIIDEAKAMIEDVRLKGEKAEDPTIARKKMADSFAAIGIGGAQLREYLGHDLDLLTPEERVELRSVYTAIKDGETTWAEIMELRSEARGSEDPAARKSLMDQLNRARFGEPPAFAAACKAAGVTTENPRLETLTLEVLRTIAAKLKGDDFPAGATKNQPANGKGGVA